MDPVSLVLPPNLRRIFVATQTQAIAIDDTNSDCFYRRGGLYFELKKLEEAAEDVKKACELDPDQPQYNALLFRIVSKMTKAKKKDTKDDDDEGDHYKVLGVERSSSMQQIRCLGHLLNNRTMKSDNLRTQSRGVGDFVAIFGRNIIFYVEVLF